MTDASTPSGSPYVLGHADAELQRLAEQSAFLAPGGAASFGENTSGEET